jgi:hypothetical protein
MQAAGTVGEIPLEIESHAKHASALVKKPESRPPLSKRPAYVL